MSNESRNKIDLLLNICIFVFTVYAISQYFTVGGSGNMTIEGFGCLKYFTNLSNIFAAIIALIAIPINIKNIKFGKLALSKNFYLLKFMSTVSVTVTFLTVVFFLGPISAMGTFKSFGSGISAYLIMFENEVFFLHFLTPVLAIISTVIVEKSEEAIVRKHAILGLIPTVLYSIVYLYQVVIVGAENGGWNDFYWFTFGGNYKMIPVSMIGMYLATYLISRLEIYLYNLKKVNV